MERPTNTIELSNGAQVVLFTFLTWGQMQAIESSLMRGANVKTDGNKPDVSFNGDFMLEAKYTALEQSIKCVIEDGKEKAFTRDWINNLSMDDGNTVYAAVEELTAKKK